MHRDFAAP